MTLDQYLQQTKYAVNQLLKNFSFYSQLWQKVIQTNRDVESFLFGDYLNDPENQSIEDEYKRWEQNNKKVHKKFQKAISNLKGACISKNAIAGAVLQIAFMGIKNYSKNDSIPENFQEFANNPNNNGLVPKLEKFSVGKTVWGEIPMGLIIYAGRNQYNHFDDHPNYNNLVEEILHKMKDYRRDEKAFEDIPSLPWQKHYTAQYMLDILHWKRYEDYKTAMKDALLN